MGVPGVPQPVRDKLSIHPDIVLRNELNMRNAERERNSERYQREQGWLDFHNRLIAVLKDYARTEGQFIRVEGVVGYMNAIHDHLRHTPLPQVPTDSDRHGRQI